MDLTYLQTVVALAATAFELAAALTGRLVQRKAPVLRKPQATSSGSMENLRLVRQVNN